MHLTPQVIGYGAALLLTGLMVQGRGWYLEQASRKIKFDPLTSVELRPAKWAYLSPISAVCVGLTFLAFACRSTGGGTVLFGILGIAMIAGGAWLWWTLRHARAVIQNGKLMYNEGRLRQEVDADDVMSVGIYWFSFRVRLTWDRQVFVPATFRSSEIILAFLRQASDKNRGGKSA
jgi:hypothetical protein